jgi:hypothetical protein
MSPQDLNVVGELLGVHPPWAVADMSVFDGPERLVIVSIKGLDERARRVDFYAPVFAGMSYRLAARVGDYTSSFSEAVGAHGVRGRIVFSCNCILNYAYGAFEGKRTAHSSAR